VPKPKANSSRKPPEPSEDHSLIQAWMGGVMPNVGPMVRFLDTVITGALEDPRFAVKWSKAHYGTPESGWVLELVAYQVSVNIVFFGGVDLDPVPPLGDSGRSRYIKLRSMEEAQDPQIAEWVGQATRFPGWAW
jgi:hypothetical protein